MQAALDNFHLNIERVRSLGGLHAAMAGLLAPIVDRSDILRAQYVMAVSALDHYVHEAVRLGMLEIFDGVRPPTPAYLRFRVSLSCIATPTTANVVRNELEADIREQHSYLSFQRPDKVANAIRLVSEQPLWENVAQSLATTPQSIKQRLTLVVDRRNKIAHEADLDPTYPNVRWPIVEADLQQVISTVQGVVESTHATIA